MLPDEAAYKPLFRDRFHRQIAELKQQTLKQLWELLHYDYGMRPVLAGELEFYVADTGPHETQDSIPAIINTSLREAGVDALPAEKERGPLQYEVALPPSNDLQAVSETLWRLPEILTRAITDRGGHIEFHAKPYEDCYGSGLHLHVHLEDKRGHNIFTRSADGHYSRELLWSIHGMLELLHESMLLFAPEKASFTRFTQIKQNAPTHICWGPNNRTVALRLPSKAVDQKHIEHRVAGADADPQLALIGLLAGICHGFRMREFPMEAIHGNASDAQYELTPIPTYAEALEAFQQSEYLPFLLGKELYSELLRRFMLPGAF